MFARFTQTRNPAARFFAALSLLWLAACDPTALSPTANVGPQIDTDAPVQVALLVPGGSGTGSDAFLAQNLENAARLAIADLNGPEVRLRVYNTAGGNPTQAANAARAAVDDGAQIILGPLFSEAAIAAGIAVAGDNINVLAFSNNPTIAGGNVFVLGPTFDNTARRLIGYANRQGFNRPYIVHAQDPGAEIGRDAIVTAANNSGTSIAGVSNYRFSQTAIFQSSSTIAREIKSSGADSVFLTGDATADLLFIGTALPEAGITSEEYQYIGLTRWDANPQVSSLPGLQGGYFAVPDKATSELFNTRYAATYGENPHPLAGLAYDGIAAIGALVASGDNRALTKQALTTSQGFQGTSGVFRLMPNGLNERALAIATFQNSQVVVLEQAPRSFGAGF